MKRRDFLKLSATAAATSIGAAGVGSTALAASPSAETKRNARRAEHYEGAHLDRIAFPMGGMGAGMICLEGTGALSHVSLSHHPDMGREPVMFAAISVKSPMPVARVFVGPVPRRKLKPLFSERSFDGRG